MSAQDVLLGTAESPSTWLGATAKALWEAIALKMRRLTQMKCLCSLGVVVGFLDAAEPLHAWLDVTTKALRVGFEFVSMHELTQEFLVTAVWVWMRLCWTQPSRHQHG